MRVLDVSISLVVYKRHDLTASILRQLAATAPNVRELFVLDNSPDDPVPRETLRDARAAFGGRLYYIGAPANLGYGAAHRINFALSAGAFSCVLNPDLELGAGWMEELLVPFGEPTIAQTGLSSGCTALSTDGCGCAGAVEYVEGACMIVRRAAILDIKRSHQTLAEALFDPVWGLGYCEDSDLSLRLREQRWRIRALDAPVHHIRCGTMDHLDPETRARWDEQREKNHREFSRRWAPYLAGDRKFDHEH